MSSVLSLSQCIKEQPAICKLLLKHYAHIFSLSVEEVAARIVMHVSKEDTSFPFDIKDAPTKTVLPLQQAESLLKWIHTRYQVSTSSILTDILQRFVRGDADLSIDKFQRFVEKEWDVVLPAQSGLAEIEQWSLRQEPNLHRCPITGVIDTNHHTEGMEQNDIDAWFNNKVQQYRCPVNLGPSDQALRGIHARELGTLNAEFIVSKHAAPRLPVDIERHGIFDHPPKRFSAIIRYSTSGGPRFESMPDFDEQQAIGLAIKVLDENKNTLHDFLFINTPTFMTNNPMDLVDQENADTLY